MQAIEINSIKRIAFWNPKVDAVTEKDTVVLIQEDEVHVVLEFPSPEARQQFIEKVAAL